MDLDEDLDDAPPLLVTEDGNPPVDAPDGLGVELEELNITKVPITIVTGESKEYFYYFYFDSLKSAYLSCLMPFAKIVLA